MATMCKRNFLQQKEASSTFFSSSKVASKHKRDSKKGLVAPLVLLNTADTLLQHQDVSNFSDITKMLHLTDTGCQGKIGQNWTGDPNGFFKFESILFGTQSALQSDKSLKRLG